MSDKKLNWGILSCARIAASAVIPGILAANNAELYAIASRTQPKLDDFAARFKPQKTFLGYQELLDDPAVDAVYIPLPNGLHREWVLKAAKAGKHVLCEKPLGLNEAETREMHQACQDAGVLLMEAYAYLHSPLTSQVKKLVDDGAIGSLRYIESGFSFPLQDRGDVRFDKALGGGATYDLGCYNLSQIHDILRQDPRKIGRAHV